MSIYNDANMNVLLAAIICIFVAGKFVVHT